jgi:TonB dependent receptor-like, beta-barrel/CarboxypepD_reg-like domain/TonB-dependent Receptor Plug Domain
MRKILLSFSLLFLLLANQEGFAQQNNQQLITGDFHQLTFEQFAQQVEAQTDYHFYFDTAQVDSIIVNFSLTGAHLQAVLDQLFRNTTLQYAIDSQDQVFITKDFAIPIQLPVGFFEGRKEALPIVTENAEGTPDYVEVKKKPEAEISVENKLFEIGLKVNYVPSGKVNIAGYVRDGKTGEAISGALVSVENPRVQVITDQFGYYSLILPAGRHTLYIRALGMFDTKRNVMLYSSGRFDINMQEKVMALREVVVESGKEKNVRSTVMGTQQLDISAIKQIPSAFGEADILKAVLEIPGVKSVGEASTGLNVRGGATDQNLILFNDMTIYNPTHLFGFFSAFDPSVVKDITLYKSSIPAKYGGRISSVLDITGFDGNDKKITGSGGIGPLTSQLTLQGPLFNGKTTFVIGGRTTYSNWILKNLKDEYNKSRAYFGDLTLHITQKINEKNFLYLNGYYSDDNFNLNSDTTYEYHNKNANFKWKHTFNNRFYGVLTTGYDHYDYQVAGTNNPVNAYQLSYNINQGDFKTDFSYFLSNQHTITFGFSSIYYKLQPGEFDPVGQASLVVPDTLEDEQALESALYLSDQYNISDNLSIEGGIRYSFYNYFGPRNIFTYPPGLPRTAEDILDTISYPANKIIKTYGGPEFRISARYAVGNNTSIKVSFNTGRQYIHLISNTTTESPTDIWKLSDPYIQPQLGKQISLGLYRNFKSNTIETSVEVYYKSYNHYLDYKSNAVLVMNPHIETDVINTDGTDYGVELLIKKTTGKLNGWFAYTFSRSLLKEDDPLAGELINNGNYYPSNFDQPQDFTLIGNYRLSHRFSVSLNITYSTGRPITLPIAEYDYAGSQRVLYSERNQYRIPDYFRTDFSMNIEGNHKIKQLTHNSWTIGVYNWTGRKNAYSVYFISQNGRVQGYELSIFGSAIPFVTYNIRF